MVYGHRGLIFGDDSDLGWFGGLKGATGHQESPDQVALGRFRPFWAVLGRFKPEPTGVVRSGSGLERPKVDPRSPQTAPDHSRQDPGDPPSLSPGPLDTSYHHHPGEPGSDTPHATAHGWTPFRRRQAPQAPFSPPTGGNHVYPHNHGIIQIFII